MMIMMLNDLFLSYLFFQDLLYYQVYVLDLLSLDIVVRFIIKRDGKDTACLVVICCSIVSKLYFPW